MFLWRDVDDEGEVLDVVVQRRRDTDAALKLIRRVLRNQPVEPEKIVTDGLASYQAAFGQLGLRHLLPAGCERTIERRTPTCRYAGESGSNSCSSPRLQPSASSPLTPQSTTPSTRNDISSAVKASAVSGRGQMRLGSSLLPEASTGWGKLWPASINLTPL